MVFFQVQCSFSSTSFLRNQDPVCGTQDSRTECCPTAAECGASNTNRLNAGAWEGNRLCWCFCLVMREPETSQRTYRLSVSHALPKGSGFRASGRQRPTLFSRDTHTCLQPYLPLSFLHSTVFIEHLLHGRLCSRCRERDGE